MAVVPAAVPRLVERRLEVVVEAGAGSAAFYDDKAYLAAGARLEPRAEELFRAADIVLKVHAPGINPDTGKHEAELIKPGAVLISFLYPLANLDLVRKLLERRVTSFAMDLMPRLSRAQSMDALSSISSISGYKAVLLAANALPKYFPMLMTAAGTITPARVLILGAGVAGLQAIATARRLGAVVEAFDVRPVVKEQVESLGARFVELPASIENAQTAGGYAREQSLDEQARIRELLKAHVQKADVVITTALIPGKEAPVLVTADMVRGVHPGSVIVDLAAEQGGNCELTEAGKTVVKNGVTLIGPMNLSSELAVHASQLYSKNITSFLLCLVDQEGRPQIQTGDELIRGPLVTCGGQAVHEPTREAMQKETSVH